MGGYGQRRAVATPTLRPIDLLLQLVQQQQGGFNEAKQANESRYLDILQLLGSTRGRTLDALKQFGDSLINDTNQNYDNKRHELITDLADRGLSGSTARIGVETGVQRERDAALNRIKDMLIQDRTNADLGFTDRAAGVMERREDPYPQGGDSTALIGQLAGLIASGGGLNGGSLGGGGHQQLPSKRLPLLQALAAAAGAATPAQPPSGPFGGPMPLSADEATRRRNMAQLYLAESPNHGTYVGDKEQAALLQSIADGTGQFQPSQVGAALIDRTPRQPIYFYPNSGYGGSGYGYRSRDYSAARESARNAATGVRARRIAQRGGIGLLGNMSMLPTPLGGSTSSVSYQLKNVPSPTAPQVVAGGGYGSMFGNGMSTALQSLAAQGPLAQSMVPMRPLTGPLGMYGGTPVGCQRTPYPAIADPNHLTMDEMANLSGYYRTVRGY